MDEVSTCVGASVAMVSMQDIRAPKPDEAPGGRRPSLGVPLSPGPQANARGDDPSAGAQASHPAEAVKSRARAAVSFSLRT